VLVSSAAEDPAQLPTAGQRFVSAFGARYRRSPGRYAAYGYEAMAVALDSIRRAGGGGDDRDSVVGAFFDTQDRDSVLGTYSIDEVGDTTLDRLAGYRVRNGRPAFATPLHP
jgi:branched-chain amino acid transport system substrate-binding protein